MAKHKLYVTYAHMKKRCYSESNKDYRHYGGRGIKVCDRWLGSDGFTNFVEDMGEKPSDKHSLDRIDNNSDYSPENCRWATALYQVNNTRKVSTAKGYYRTKHGTYKAYITYDGKNKWLGTYKTEEEAHQAYVTAKNMKLKKLGV